MIGSTLPPGRVEEAVAYAAASAGIEDGHVAIEFVDSERIAELNETWREKEGPTDVLSFPVDEDEEDLTGLPRRSASWATSSSALSTPRIWWRPSSTASCT